MPRRIAAPQIAVVAVLSLAGCAASHHAARNGSSRVSTTAPPSTAAPIQRAAAQIPVPTSIDAHGNVTTQCVTLPANWQMCAVVNGDGSIETLTTLDSRTVVNCVDATAATKQLPAANYDVACRVFKDRTPTTQNPGDLPGHPLLCTLVNDGTLQAGKATPATILNAPILCIDTVHSSVTLYRRGQPPMPCHQSGALADCRPTS